MAEALTYFQTMIEVIVGIIGFQVIAVSFVFSRKEDWHMHDSFMFYGVIFLNMIGMAYCAVPSFISINLSTESSSFDFWDIFYKIGLISQFVLLIHGHLYNVKLFRDIKLFLKNLGLLLYGDTYSNMLRYTLHFLSSVLFILLQFIQNIS